MFLEQLLGGYLSFPLALHPINGFHIKKFLYEEESTLFLHLNEHSYEENCLKTKIILF